PAEIQSGLQKKVISMGHAKALINISDKEKIIEAYERIIANKLSVRETEKIIRELSYPAKKVTTKKTKNKLPEKFVEFKNKLSDVLKSNVSIKRNNAGKGSLTIPFTSDEEFEKIKKLLSKISK
ncbi:MAG: chromosome partitioning protein ParB, partial [Chlorobi bacterium]|nr:chromosome partitioning protein ParB [Chlorobiota bacterium]